MPTRQQRRAKARAPARQKRRGQMAFLAVMVAVLLGGGAAATIFVRNPQPIKRGAIAGEHWHADLAIEICGTALPPFPHNEAEIHTHGDGRVHVHPQTAAYSGNNANLGRFFESVEVSVGQSPDGKRFIVLPDGKRYQDADRCEASGTRYDLVAEANGQRIAGDPGKYVIHDGDRLLIRFGPPAEAPASRPTTAPETPTSTRR